MANDPLLAEKHINNAARQVERSLTDLQADESANGRAYERFYNTLALFSGGTIALSVTYLRYLKNLSKPVVSVWFLTTSWSLLLLSLVTALFWSFFYANCVYYAGVRQHLESKAQQRSADAEAIQALHIVNVRSAAERLALEARLRGSAERFAGQSGQVQGSENRYCVIWKWDGRVARAAFVAGICFLLWFALRNI